MHKRRPLYLMAFGVVAVPLIAASIAYACGALASLSVSSSSADAGNTITGVGRGFSSSHGGAPSAEPVVIHFNSRTGPVLWSGRPDANGVIEYSFTVPKVDPGSYTLVATQTNADGEPAPGTPARASFTVTGPAPVAAAPVAAAAPEAAPVAAPAPAAAPAATATAAPRVRVAPAASATRVPAPAPAPAAAPAPVAAPAPEAAPAPVAAPAVTPVAPEATPAPAPARRSVMVSMSGDSDGSPALAIALVGVGLVLALGASALVLAGRRDSKAPAKARR